MLRRIFERARYEVSDAGNGAAARRAVQALAPDLVVTDVMMPVKHTFRIGSGGVEVFPRIETLIPHVVTAVSDQVPSGIPGLDKLMSGGAKQGDATLVTGPSGVGKTIFGLGWLTQGVDQGKRCLYVTFQDTADQLVDLLRSDGRSGPRRPGHCRALRNRGARDQPDCH
jgi:CheY-like chemotaxis protein